MITQRPEVIKNLSEQDYNDVRAYFQQVELEGELRSALDTVIIMLDDQGREKDSNYVRDMYEAIVECVLPDMQAWQERIINYAIEVSAVSITDILWTRLQGWIL